MGAPRTKADKAAEMLADISVADWDQRLINLSREWMFAYGYRELRAKIEGVTAPPPPPPVPPKIEGARSAPSSAEKKRVGGPETVLELIDLYRTDPESPYQKVRPASRDHYHYLLNRLAEEIGGQRIAEVKAQDARNFYEGWRATGKLTMAHHLMTMLRMIAGFGANVLEEQACIQLSVILHQIKLPMLQARKGQLTEQQVKLICAKAHERNRPSIALAQAIQFECGLRQIEVIGEWVPREEAGAEDVIDHKRNEKWINGLTWKNFDGSILRYRESWSGKEQTIDLSKKPLVTSELAKWKGAKSGPVIVQDTNNKGLPWRADEFRRQWRYIARAAGVPDEVKNMDSRPKARAEKSDDGVLKTELEERPSLTH
jgi:hypothetical protein